MKLFLPILLLTLTIPINNILIKSETSYFHPLKRHKKPKKKIRKLSMFYSDTFQNKEPKQMLSVLLPICLMFLLIGAPVWAVGLLTFPAIIGLIKILFGINKKNGDAKKAKEANKPKKKEGEEDEDDEDEEEELDENGQPIPKAPKRGGPDAPDAPDAPEAPEAPEAPGMPGMPGRERKLGRDGFRVLGILGDRELRNFKRVLRDKRNRKLFFREKKRIYEFFRVNGIVLEKGRKRKGVRKLTVRYLKDYHPGFKGTEVFVDKVLNILFFNKKRIFNFIGHQ